jgi:hypothetical protein
VCPLLHDTNLTINYFFLNTYIESKKLHYPSMYVCFHPKSFIHSSLRYRFNLFNGDGGNVFSMLHTKVFRLYVQTPCSCRSLPPWLFSTMWKYFSTLTILLSWNTFIKKNSCNYFVIWWYYQLVMVTTIHYYKMHLSSLWVSLDFEWIWTFSPNEII